MTRIFTLTLLLLIPCLQALAESTPFPGVQKLMNPGEYEAAGLDKLGPAEIEALNQWLIRYTADENPTAAPVHEDAQGDFEIRARIKQPFKGWSGKTVFYLDNGQVWRQRHSGHYRYKGQDTEVVISRNFLGFHVLTLSATGKAIGVSRVR